MILILLSVGLLAGCNQETKNTRVDGDTETPIFKKAKEKYDLRDYYGAIELFEEVLRENPAMAKSHLELGLIYDDKLGDYVSAIYHYRKYLKLKPNGDKAVMVSQWIPRAELAFASQQPNSPIQSADELVRLQKENLSLKSDMADLRRSHAQSEKQLAAMTEENGRLKSAPPAATPSTTETGVQTPAKTTAAAQSPTQAVKQPTQANTTAHAQASANTAEARSHVVQQGDTVWKISAKYYPGKVKEGVEKITEANKETTPNAAKLKLGQTLVIP